MLWLLYVFIVGLAIGSFLNVCVARLPYEKSLLWPGSHCPSCWQPIRFRDNVPLLGFLLLRGRCRSCGAAISWRYPLVELFTGLVFVLLYYLEMVHNAAWTCPCSAIAGAGWACIPFDALPVFLHHSVLMSFLIVTSLCDLADMEIPLGVTVTGALVGLVLATFLAWPYPEPPPLPAFVPPGGRLYPPYPGAYPWPVWYPLPNWLPPGSWQLGLATGLAGALAGMVMLRGVRFLFGVGRGLVGLGVGDADLMMMAGAFVGWQPVVLGFFVSVGPALLFAIVRLVRKGNQTMPFGPSLAMGVLIALLCWPALGNHFRMLFFDPVFLGVMGVGGGLALLLTAFLLRLVRRRTGTPAGT